MSSTFQTQYKRSLEHEITIEMLIRDALYDLKMSSPQKTVESINAVWIAIPRTIRRKIGIGNLNPYKTLQDKLTEIDFKEFEQKAQFKYRKFEYDEVIQANYLWKVKTICDTLLEEYIDALYKHRILMETKVQFIEGISKKQIEEMKKG